MRGIERDKKTEGYTYINTYQINGCHSKLLLLFVGGVIVFMFGSCAEQTVSDEVIELEMSCGQQFICQGSVEVTCAGTANEQRRDCSLINQSCVLGYGCLACDPGVITCQGNSLSQCAPDGRSLAVISECEQGCRRGTCVNLCEEVAAESSYLGCEYWPTPLGNIVSPEFSFAIAVANPNTKPVSITVELGGDIVRSSMIAAGELEVIPLPWINRLSTPPDDGFTLLSSKVPRGAYRLKTTLPVTAYQFNPLQYKIDEDCPNAFSDTPNDGQCFSFSNDASLLLPAHALRRNYMILTYPTNLTFIGSDASGAPGSFQVIGISPNPTEVTIEFSGYTEAGSGNSEIQSYSPGTEATFTIQQGEVLQILGRQVTQCNANTVSDSADASIQYCPLGVEEDLSGTLIRSSEPVQVFGSHICSFIPYNSFACDHLEESLFPLETWGRSAVVGVTQPLRMEPNLIRVFSGADQNMLTFTPEVHPAVTLNQGEWVEFETRESFRVIGSQSIQVLQFLVGQNYGGAFDQEGFGDPSISLVPPEDQFRTSYTFLAPDTYEQHWINLIAKPNQVIQLNGDEINAFAQIEGTDWAESRVEIPAGVYTATSDQPFGVWVYGFGSYTSYMYPAGLDLRPINDVMY